MLSRFENFLFSFKFTDIEKKGRLDLYSRSVWKKSILCSESQGEDLNAQCGKLFIIDEINRKCTNHKTTFLRPKT